MNAQEIFSKSRAHVIKQGQPAVTYDANGKIKCAYRLQSKGRVLKCGIGCFIPKSKYTPGIEDHSITIGVLDCLPKGFAEHSELLDDLQSAHDDAAEYSKSNPDDFIEMYKANMKMLAESNGLQNV